VRSFITQEVVTVRYVEMSGDYALSLPLRRTACPNFCSLVSSWSPCFTTSLYCRFLSSGRLVSMVPFTRSIVQFSFFDGMNFDKSLRFLISMSDVERCKREGVPVQPFHGYAKLVSHVL